MNASQEIMNFRRDSQEKKNKMVHGHVLLCILPSKSHIVLNIHCKSSGEYIKLFYSFLIPDSKLPNTKNPF
jgi:hypothetical protein